MTKMNGCPRHWFLVSGCYHEGRLPVVLHVVSVSIKAIILLGSLFVCLYEGA